MIHFEHQTIDFNRHFLRRKRLALKERIYRFVKEKRDSFKGEGGFHTAQNTREEVEVINDFVEAVNQHIAMMGVSPEFVVNIDETDLPFDLPATRTLSRRGRRSVSIAGDDERQGHRSARCFVDWGEASRLSHFQRGAESASSIGRSSAIVSVGDIQRGL